MQSAEPSTEDTTARMAQHVGQELGWQCALEAVANEAELFNNANTPEGRLAARILRLTVDKLKEQGFTPDA